MGKKHLRAQAGARPGGIRGGGAAGQAIPLDFAAGLFIFMLILVYFIIQWDLFSTRAAEKAEKSGLDSGAIELSEMLVHGGGSPQNWTDAPESAQAIGLASSQNVLDWNRVAAFESLPYANAKQVLGIDHDFLVVIETPDGARYATIGQDGNSTRAAEVTRIAVVNNTVVHVKVRLYE